MENFSQIYLVLAQEKFASSQGIPFNLWASKMVGLLKIFDITHLTFGETDQVLNAIFVPRKQLHPVHAKLVVSAEKITEQDFENNNVEGTWLNIRWPRLIIGEKEAYNVETHIEREIVLHTLASLGKRHGSSLTGLMSLLPKKMYMGRDKIDDGDEYYWDSPDLEFKIFIKEDGHCFCEIFIYLEGKLFYHERLRNNRKYPGKVVAWPKGKNIPLFKDHLSTEIICFVRWLLLTTVELARIFDNDKKKLTENYLARHTTIGKVARRAQKIEQLIFDAFPKDVAGIIADYYHSSTINKSPSVKQFLKACKDL